MLRRFEEFCTVISSIQHHIQKIERDEMAKYGLKGPHAQYLVTISRFPQGVTAAQLCQLCERDKAAVSRALAELERRALVTRAAANDTAYRALVTLTTEGRSAARFVSEKVRQAMELAGRGMSDGDRQVLYDSLRRIAGNLHAIGETGLPEGHKA